MTRKGIGLSRARANLAALALLAVALASVSADAATTHDVDVRDNEFVAAGTAAVAGDTVSWKLNRSNNQHTITAYAGATFNSGPLFQSQTYSAPFDGGTVRYRCTFHSSIDSNDDCTGMCGVISDTPPPLEPPRFSYPPNNDVSFTPYVTFNGSVASNIERVILMEGGAVLGSDFVEGVGFEITTGKLGNGPHTVNAIGVTAEGFRTAPSDSLTVTVDVEDSTPPTIGISSPNSPTAPRNFTFVGDAFDDVGVDSITIQAFDILGAPASIQGLVIQHLGTNHVHFYGTVRSSTPGRYTVVAVATDVVDHTARATRDVIVLV